MATLKILAATVLMGDGTDQIFLHLDHPTAFPEMKYAPMATLQARQGFGVEWCRKVLGLEPETVFSSLSSPE